MTWKIKKGYLWKLTGEWEKHFERGIVSQCMNEKHHLTFWQDSESAFGSYILMSEEPELNWGSAEQVDVRKLFDVGITCDRPLLDCNESGVAAYILDIDSDNEVTIALRY